MTRPKLSFDYFDYYGSNYWLGFIHFIAGLQELLEKGLALKVGLNEKGAKTLLLFNYGGL